MSRGVYDVIRTGGGLLAQSAVHEHKHDDDLAIRLELQESLACWYEFLLNPSERKIRLHLADQLRAMQAKVAALPMARQHGYSDFCILSFLGVRTRIRFSTMKPPKFSLFGSEFIFYVEIGKERILKKLTTTFMDSHSGNAIKPHINMDEYFITIAFSDEEQERVSVHDFLRKCGLELEVNTVIYAVEHTQQPAERWLEASSRSLTQMLYDVSNEACDFFFFCNLFKLTLVQLNQSAYTTDGLPNYPGRMESSLTMQERGQIIETAFRTYFGLPQHHLPNVHRGHPMNTGNSKYTVQVLMELNNPHELYRFGSEKVEASDKHMFTCEIQGDQTQVSILN